MNRKLVARILSLLLLSATVEGVPSSHAAGAEAPPVAAAKAPPPVAALPPLVFQQRGVYYFPGRIKCPLAGVGSRGDYDSNRVALDDPHSQVSVDRTARRITLVNSYSYAKKQIAADFLFLAEATTQAGKQVPGAVHVKVEKKGTSTTVDIHSHPSTNDTLVSTPLRRVYRRREDPRRRSDPGHPGGTVRRHPPPWLGGSARFAPPEYFLASERCPPRPRQRGLSLV